MSNNVSAKLLGKMKRKVVKLNSLRLSPNEEALLIKEEHERRRRLRIKQVREQERSIAVQIREEVKHRRNQQLEQLANELKAEWQMAQMEKAQSLEKLYLSSLKAVGEGHRQAKENEPDLKACSKLVAVNREKAEKRHREALRELKQQKNKDHEVQNRYIETRKKALLIEKKRALKIAHLPPPPPNPVAVPTMLNWSVITGLMLAAFYWISCYNFLGFWCHPESKEKFMDLEVQNYPAVKMYDIDSFSVTHYHLPEPCVDRESDTQQLSAELTAQEEAERLEDLQQEAEMERLEQLEKARLRGSRALQLVHLIQDREKLVKELGEMQQADLAHRRQTVAQMPPQLFEPPYRCVQVKEDRQREMEFAFEDMYADDKKVRGDLILQLEHEPLPAPTIGVQDEDLDLSVDPDGFQKEQQHENATRKDLSTLHLGNIRDLQLVAASQPSACPTKAALKKLFTKIKTQRDYCSKPEPKYINKDMTIESGSITSEKNDQRTLTKSTADNLSEEHLEMLSALIQTNKQQNKVPEDAIKAGNATLSHPKEQASGAGSEIDRRKQLQHHKHFLSNVPSPDHEHMCTIHWFQQHLIEQNRLHKTSLEEIRKQLDEYQLKQGWSFVSTTARHLAEQQLPSQMKHYNKSTGSELRVDVTRFKPGETCVLSAQYPSFENQSRALCQTQPTIVPFVHLQQTELPYKITCQSPQVSQGTQVPVGTICLPESSENVSVFSLRHQLLKNSTLFNSALLKTTQQDTANPESTVTQQQRDEVDAGSNRCGGPDNVNCQSAYNVSNSESDLPKSKKYNVPDSVLEVNGVEVSEPCATTSGTVEPQQDLNTGRTKENFQLKNEDQLKDLEPTAPLNGTLNPLLSYDSKSIQTGSYFSASRNGDALTRDDQHWRPSKPPVTKRRLGHFGLFDQHELSAIQEGESPKSDRLSLFDLSRVSTSSCHQMSNIAGSTVDSIRMSRLTWRDKLKLETSHLPGQGLTHVESTTLEFAGPTCRAASKVLFPYSCSGDIQKTSEEGQLSSTTLSTGSLTSSDPTDIGPLSPGDHSSTAHDIMPGQSTPPSTSSPSLSVNKDTAENQDIEHCGPSLEECIPTGRKIQQVVEKYTRNLNQLINSSGKNQDPATVHNTSTQGVPNFHVKLQSSQPDSDLELQPLETRPDFGVSSTSLSSTSNKNSNVLDTDSNTHNQHSNPGINQVQAPIKSFTDSIESTPDHGSGVCNTSQRNKYIQQDYDFEDGRLKTFQPLRLEISSNKYSLDTGSRENVMCNRLSEQGFNNGASSINCLHLPPLDLIRPETAAAGSQILESIDQSICSDSSTENLQGDVRENTQECFGSFSQLNATQSSENDHNCDTSDQNGKHLEVCESITSHAVTFTKLIKSKKVNEVGTLNDQSTELSNVISPRKKNCTGSEVLCVSEQNHMVQSGQLSHGRTQTAARLEFETEQDQPLSSNLTSEVCTLQSIIPAREIGSNLGIMEEPELSQLSMNDSTLIDEELGQESPTKYITCQNEFQTFTRANELQPSKLKTTDHAISTSHNLVVADHKINHTASSFQKSPTVMVFQFDSPPKILNEVVLKKKHKFLANSAKRVEDMKRKGRSGKANSELLEKKKSLKQEQLSVFASSSVAAHLKAVGQVKVSTPEDRKAAEVEMQKRTFCLYSQLDEVKNRKKEVTRQIVCARNSEKAKEFQKVYAKPVYLCICG
ncbi:centrosomal protein of 295 kDa isoform X3 [Rhincodon typus]|uniref:centrosomal protein of 295 kDa isoform X3 n=1 Tax=Rhincodon typus TaxID=259920 RepID=UPI0020300C60|nr:centrosomal protein of 295 kDa isoform X3 [Rhincodon typus]